MKSYIYSLQIIPITISLPNIKDVKRISNQVLEKINQWCQENTLSININKSEYVVYGTKNKKAKTNKLKINIGSSELREVDDYKYLGTVIDSKLNGRKQLEKITKQIAIKLNTF